MRAARREYGQDAGGAHEEGPGQRDRHAGDEGRPAQRAFLPQETPERGQSGGHAGSSPRARFSKAWRSPQQPAYVPGPLLPTLSPRSSNSSQRLNAASCRSRHASPPCPSADARREPGNSRNHLRMRRRGKGTASPGHCAPPTHRPRASPRVAARPPGRPTNRLARRPLGTSAPGLGSSLDRCREGSGGGERERKGRIFPNKNKRRGEGAVRAKGRGPGAGALRGRWFPGPRTPPPALGTQPVSGRGRQETPLGLVFK